MPRSKIEWLLLGLFLIAFVFSRFSFIPQDEINPDSVNWHYRSQQFVIGLKTFDFAKTYQHYHPGVTLMWISGIPIELYKQISGIQFYDISNFYLFHLIAKSSVVVIQLVLTGILVYLLAKEFGFTKALLIATIFSFEPFFIGNSRLFHLDILHTLLTFIALTLYWHYLKQSTKSYLFFSAFFMAMAFLTKSVSVIFLFGVLIYTLGLGILTKSMGKSLKAVLTYVLLFIVSTFIFFPALWVRPVATFNEIFSEAERVGGRKGHEQVFLGEFSEDPGILFYPVAFLIKTSPLLFIFTFVALIITAVGFVKRLKFKKFSQSQILQQVVQPSLPFFLSVFYLGYILVMSFLSKKLDRYLLILFPYVAVICINYYYKYFKFVIPAALFSLIYTYVILNPYFFAYTSPLLISSENANRLILQKPFGQGIDLVNTYILENYGKDTKVGFLDIKPIEAIYPNSLVYDIREYGTGKYDLIVLGIGEDFPDNINGKVDNFELVHTIVINDMDYWRIYEKTK